MALARTLLVAYLALAVGLGVAFVVAWVAGPQLDVRTMAVLFGASALGATYGNVRRHRAARAG